MAQNTTITLTAGSWTLLTNSDVTALTFSNESPHAVVIKGTLGATPPSDFTGAITFLSNQGELNAGLSDLWPGIAATRVYAFCNKPAQVTVSHA